MLIELREVSKRYKHWVIYHCTETMRGPSTIALVGANGSGKSTLLKMISGYLSPTSGEVVHCNDANEPLQSGDLVGSMGFAAPYLEYIEELTLIEHFQFHFEHKKLQKDLTKERFFQLIRLEEYQHERLADLSSGLKQRFILGLTILSDSELYLLDEPCSFLDEQAQQWFFELVTDFLADKLCIIATNQQVVIDFCQQALDVKNYKPETRKSE